MFGNGPVVEAEKARVEAAGGWVADGRVCDVIAVSRAFGDLQFKEDAGRQEMLAFGVECVSPVAPLLLIIDIQPSDHPIHL